MPLRALLRNPYLCEVALSRNINASKKPRAVIGAAVKKTMWKE
jgi:hypothetical protein